MQDHKDNVVEMFALIMHDDEEQSNLTSAAPNE
jgi:hypothetical protein